MTLLSPRLGILALWIFTDVLSDAYGSWVVPFIGFFILPWTTLAYAVMWFAGSDGVSWIGWVVVALAFVADLGAWVGSKNYR
ncbi:MAG: hypothetical protein ACR2N5_05115 [Solirubrobacterales bacterium]